MSRKSEEFHNLLVRKISYLCFGTERCYNASGRGLVAAWLKQNGLGPKAIKGWFGLNTEEDTTALETDNNDLGRQQKEQS